jgi:hypothetical protein
MTLQVPREKIFDQLYDLSRITVVSPENRGRKAVSGWPVRRA